MMLFVCLLLLLSIVLNVLLCWYIRKMLSNLLFVSDNIGDLLQELDEFSIHLQNVHEMEMYYGEPTLQRLIEHSKKMVEEIEGYKQIYGLTLEVIEENKEEGEVVDGPQEKKDTLL